MKNIIFIHGLESSGKGFKGLYLKKIIPEILAPDFAKFNQKRTLDNLLNARMAQLNAILSERDLWIVIGSSFGGLMGVLYTLQNPKKIKRLILLAPYLATKLLKSEKYPPITIPVIVFHGKNDEVANFKASREQAYKLFPNLEFNATEDDHNLNKTVETLNWITLTS
ncbi:MAG: alpha/beta fold hydrolase [Promethearchaeota archaeon]